MSDETVSERRNRNPPGSNTQVAVRTAERSEASRTVLQSVRALAAFDRRCASVEPIETLCVSMTA
ncbi:hypothetical protein [Halovenus sp. HT40]|uniref:hypothetical protein n=1 Tax=Halovenus sp. HT40 TaxID=3126691 RepID=UPI00300EBF6E